MVRRGEAPRLVVDERPEVADLAGLCRHGGCDPGDHLAELHAAHDVHHIGNGLVGLPVLPHLASRAHDHEDVGVGRGELHRLVSHVVRAEDDELCSLRNEAFAKLGNGGPRPVRGVGLVDVDHLCARHLAHEVLDPVVIGLAPTLVVVRSYHHQPDGQGAGCRSCSGHDQRRQNEQHHSSNPHDSPPLRRAVHPLPSLMHAPAEGGAPLAPFEVGSIQLPPGSPQAGTFRTLQSAFRGYWLASVATAAFSFCPAGKGLLPSRWQAPGSSA